MHWSCIKTEMHYMKIDRKCINFYLKCIFFQGLGDQDHESAAEVEWDEGGEQGAEE